VIYIVLAWPQHEAAAARAAAIPIRVDPHAGAHLVTASRWARAEGTPGRERGTVSDIWTPLDPAAFVTSPSSATRASVLVGSSHAHGEMMEVTHAQRHTWARSSIRRDRRRSSSSRSGVTVVEGPAARQGHEPHAAGAGLLEGLRGGRSFHFRAVRASWARQLHAGARAELLWLGWVDVRSVRARQRRERARRKGRSSRHWSFRGASGNKRELRI